MIFRSLCPGNQKPDNAGARAIFEGASRKMGQYGDLINDLRLLRSAVDFGDD